MNTSTSSLLTLTGVAVTMEVGLLVASLSAGQSPAVTGVVLGAFHVGYLFADRVSQWPVRRIQIVSTISALTVPVLFLSVGALASSPAVLVMATGTQALRRQLKRVSKPQVAVKNSAKFVAMVLGGVAAWDPGLVMIAGVAAMGVVTARGGSPVPPSAGPEIAPLPRQLERRLLTTEFTHHAHYFLYCYTFWRLADSLDGWIVGPLFTIGWLAYFVAEGVIGRRWEFSPTAMCLGHLCCALCLGGMLLSSNAGWLMAMWFLTGVGGGTAYMLGNGPQAVRRERAEDWGHVVGTLVGGAVAGSAVTFSISAAGIVALITALYSLSLRTFTSDQKEGQNSAPSRD